MNPLNLGRKVRLQNRFYRRVHGRIPWFVHEVSFKTSGVNVTNFGSLVGQHELKERRPQHKFDAFLEVFLPPTTATIFSRVSWGE